MKKLIIIGMAAVNGYRENGKDLISLITHEDGCDFEQLAQNVKWKCHLDKHHRRRCQPADCRENTVMSCKCRKRYV